MVDKKLAEKAWEIAEWLMDQDSELLRIDGVEWTGIAKVLDELSGRYDWGILEDLKRLYEERTREDD